MLDIPYIRLHFELEIEEDSILPVNKASALRGGMGQMLLRSCCVADRDCDQCRFRKDCIVQRIMYSPFAIKPPFVTEGESIGFVLDCEDFRKVYYKGEILPFEMTLFGGTVVFFYQILEAFSMLGREGLGKDHAHFTVRSVTNTQRQALVLGSDIDMGRYDIHTLSDYVIYRMRTGIKNTRMKFHSPVAIKFMGDQIRQFDPEPVITSLCRRIYMLDCYEGIEVPQYDPSGKFPLMTGQQVENIHTARYSTSHKEKIHLKGIKGYMDLENIDDEIYTLLLAGEITHIGSNTKFGFGRYTLL